MKKKSPGLLGHPVTFLNATVKIKLLLPHSALTWLSFASKKDGSLVFILTTDWCFCSALPPPAHHGSARSVLAAAAAAAAAAPHPHSSHHPHTLPPPAHLPAVFSTHPPMAAAYAFGPLSPPKPSYQPLWFAEWTVNSQSWVALVQVVVS